MTCPQCQGIDRRTLVSLLGLGVASVLTGCDMPRSAATAAIHMRPTPYPAPTSTTTLPATLPPIPPPAPGPSQVIWQGPPAAIAARQVAITIDDGFCAECVQAYTALAQATGIHITFNPNGCYGEIWTPLAKTLNPLIEAGQVQIANHTFNHWWLTKLADNQVTAQLEKNEEWIEQTYGITGRPWWRPPYGAFDERTKELAASIGYTSVMMWSGSYGDSTLLRPRVLLKLAREYLRPGAVILGHANYPTVTHLFPEIAEIIASRGLHPVTLDEMFGTSRSTGRWPAAARLPARSTEVAAVPRGDYDDALRIHRDVTLPAFERPGDARSWTTHSSSGRRPPRCGGCGSTAWRSTRAATGTPTYSARPLCAPALSSRSVSSAYRCSYTATWG